MRYSYGAAMRTTFTLVWKKARQKPPAIKNEGGHGEETAYPFQIPLRALIP
ncbi:MAG: hypothetical protein RML39_11615 [Oscillatoriaceae cyanobacterium SKYGB_i_bin93]|nr:hypothetical protein [Oscillatoriaceae cyanobacterium SKYGB_i_bin93]